LEVIGLILFAFVSLFDFALSWVNWEARVKRGAIELNPLWRFFDKSGKRILGHLIPFVVVIVIGFVLLVLNLTWVLGFLFGVLFVNLYYDYSNLLKLDLCGKCENYTTCLDRSKTHCFPRIDGERIGHKTFKFIYWLLFFGIFILAIPLIFSILFVVSDMAGFIFVAASIVFDALVCGYLWKNRKKIWSV